MDRTTGNLNNTTKVPVIKPLFLPDETNVIEAFINFGYSANQVIFILDIGQDYSLRLMLILPAMMTTILTMFMALPLKTSGKLVLHLFHG